MNRPAPQFRARLRFHFREHGEDRWNNFVFPEDGQRRVPMRMDGVTSMYTLAMWHDGEGRFEAGDEIDVDCVSICPEAIDRAVVPDATFELWDAGFFAEGRVIERFDDAWPEQDEDKLVMEQRYFVGTIEDAWSRCFEVWRSDGRVEDYPHGFSKPRYWPSLGKRLGQEFARRYRDQYAFVIEKLESQDPVVVITAFDLLELIAWEFYDELPREMLTIDVPIPEPAATEIRSAFCEEFGGRTVGEFLPFLLENG